MRISDWSSDVCSSDLSETFTALLDGGAVPADPAVWESSRFALDVGWGDSSRARGLARATYELLAGMIEFSLSRRSEEHTSELQSLMRISSAVFCLKKNKAKNNTHQFADQLTRRTQQTNHT